MEMCDRKNMFDDKSTFGSSQKGQNMPKTGQQEKIFFCTFKLVNCPSFNVKNVLHFTFPLKICTFFKGISTEFMDVLQEKKQSCSFT